MSGLRMDIVWTIYGQTKPNASPCQHILKNYTYNRVAKRKVLPKGWRPLAVEMLAGKGIQLNVQQLSDIMRDKNQSEEIVTAVSEVVTELRKKFACKRKRIAALRKLI